MRRRNFFSAAIRQGSGAWPPFPDNNSWICLFFTLVALSCHRLVSPFHRRRPLSPHLSVFSPPHSPFCLFLCLCLPQRFVQRTVVAMAFVCRAPAAVTMAGWAPGVTRGRVTLAATSTALARTENVNAARVGTGNIALLVRWEEVLFGWAGLCEWGSVCSGRFGAQQRRRLSVCLPMYEAGFEGKGPAGEERQKHA